MSARLSSRLPYSHLFTYTATFIDPPSLPRSVSVRMSTWIPHTTPSSSHSPRGNLLSFFRSALPAFRDVGPGGGPRDMCRKATCATCRTWSRLRLNPPPRGFDRRRGGSFAGGAGSFSTALCGPCCPSCPFPRQCRPLFPSSISLPPPCPGWDAALLRSRSPKSGPRRGGMTTAGEYCGTGICVCMCVCRLMEALCR